ncbi:ATP-NAD kinase family protein [Thermococcus radiotolerans]|uniref:ATP-NAD kinase n=1 Tax=Thermococcus radiotolerans TaxID=187880 RepID=A0A2Z2N9K7_9EURY|nr:ATP-NAD kinase family protein [Thermococcus radiotolerans]ASJ14509.1 ATP-NAD kinase [Thermococcus radiotolerans]
MRVGLIINPIAGMGGKVALKGTDGVVEEAIKRGARPIAADVARLFLHELSNYAEGKDVEFLTGPDGLGEEVLAEFDFPYEVIRHRDVRYREVLGVRIPDTDSDDTKELVKRMLGRVELIVFAGGDGTARDVFSVAGREVPILGVPTGVKMFSGVFAASPEDAARLVVEFLNGNAKLVERDVMDLDENAFRHDEVRPKHYGKALTPYAELLLQGAKEPTKTDEAEDVDAIIAALAEELEDGIYFLGAGSTVKKLKDLLGINGTLLGVDIVEIKNGEARLIVKDAAEKDLLRFAGENARIVVTVIGGLGFLFGRGNQQFSAEVLRRIPKENIIVVATPSKLRNGFVRVYTGDREVDDKLRGYIRVRVSPWMERMVKVL